MAIREGDIVNFRTLEKAFDNDDVCLVESRDTVTGEYRALVCAINRSQAGEVTFVPLAVLPWDNPYDMFMDPSVETLPPATPRGWSHAGGPTDA